MKPNPNSQTPKPPKPQTPRIGMVTENAESSGAIFAYVLFAMKSKKGRENGNRDEKGRGENLILVFASFCRNQIPVRTGESPAPAPASWVKQHLRSASFSALYTKHTGMVLTPVLGVSPMTLKP